MALTAPEQDTLRQLDEAIALLLVYQGVLEQPVLRCFQVLLRSLRHPAHPLDPLEAYGQWFRALATQSTQDSNPWPEAVLQATLMDTNPFTQAVQHRPLTELSPGLHQAAQQDLKTLQQLYELPPQTLSHWLQQVTGRAVQASPNDPAFCSARPGSSPSPQSEPPSDWRDLEFFVDHYRRQGTGLFGRYRALSWVEGKLSGIPHPDPVQLDQLVGYEHPKQLLLQNTARLLRHQPALNVLLYGSRGAGKSSLVKALPNAYGDDGLRLIEVSQAQLIDLPKILELLRPVPQKFIVFVDDLSFEEDNPAFKTLKVMLEGSVVARPPNVVIYATSNRRHLVREFQGDRPQLQNTGEIHPWDTVQEKLSFSDRFGLTLTFEPATQDTFLTIVRHLAQQENLPLAPEALEFQARRWATRHNGQSGRTARQFVDWLKGET
ncbi:MAG: ATP-binding protein [Synechococcales cyanobacterium CRU_2_2]|nr:ATP-binding protein [Synechococcales cyanobacterium CRU_2_2]